MDWHLLAAAVICMGCALGLTPVYLRWRREQINALWDDIYIQLRQRYTVLRAFAQFAAKELGDAALPQDQLDSRLKELEETNDPLTHADLHNEFIPMILRAVQQCHRDAGLRHDPVWRDALDKMGLIDSLLVVLRDRYNERAQHYNELLYRFPFSLVTSLLGIPEKPAFPLVIHWWSSDPRAYGGTGVPAIDLESPDEPAIGESRDRSPRGP